MPAIEGFPAVLYLPIIIQQDKKAWQNYVPYWGHFIDLICLFANAFLCLLNT